SGASGCPPTQATLSARPAPAPAAARGDAFAARIAGPARTADSLRKLRRVRGSVCMVLRLSGLLLPFNTGARGQRSEVRGQRSEIREGAGIRRDCAEKPAVFQQATLTCETHAKLYKIKIASVPISFYA